MTPHRRSRSLGRLLGWSLVVLAGLVLVAPATAEAPANRPLSLELPQGLAAGPTTWTSPEGLSSTLQVMLLLTVLSMAPAILLMTTCFVRIVVVLSLLRQALGTQQLPPSQVITSIALFLTLVDHDARLEAGLRPGDRALHAQADRPGGGLDGRALRRSASS